MKLLPTIICLLTLFSISIGSSIKDDYYECNYINHDIVFTLNKIESIELTQQDNTYTFQKELTQEGKAKFIFDAKSNNIRPGRAVLTEFPTEGEPKSYDIIFTELFFDPDLERMNSYDEIIVTDMACKFKREHLVFMHYNSFNQSEVIEFRETKDYCGVSIHDDAPTGYYEVFAKNPYTSENVYVSYFTLISKKDDITKEQFTVQLPLPTEPNNFMVSFTIKYSSSMEPIKYIYIRREEEEVPFQLSLKNENGRYFTYEKNGNEYVYTIHFRLESKNLMYYIEEILLENFVLVSFDEYEYSFGSYFKINEMFVLPQHNDEIKLEFDFAFQAEKYKTEIYYKDLINVEAGIQLADCKESLNNILFCHLNTNVKSVFAIGIKPSLISGQLISSFGYSLDNVNGINLCLVEGVPKDEAVFSVTVTLPQYEYPSELTVIGELISEEGFIEDCNVEQDKDLTNNYKISCNANQLENADYKMEIGIGIGSNVKEYQFFKVENTHISVQKKYASNVQEKILFYTNNPQLLTIVFNDNVPLGYADQIQLRQENKQSRTYNIKTDNGKTKVYEITNLIETDFIFEKAQIYYKYPCYDSNDFYDSTNDITIAPNKIKSIVPPMVVISANTEAIVTFEYPLSGVEATLLFESGKGNVEYKLHSHLSDTVTIRGDMFTFGGSYNVYMKYPHEEFMWGEFFVYENPIMLVDDDEYVKPDEVKYETEIELVHGIILDQIYKIEFLNTKRETEIVYLKEDKDKYKDNIQLNARIKTLTIKYFIQLQRSQNVKFLIYDIIAPEKAITYTIYCQANINIRVANLVVDITNPAKEGQNLVFFNFTTDEQFQIPYDVNQVRTVVFIRQNRATSEETDVMYCNHYYENENQYNGLPCEYYFDIIETTDETYTSLLARVNFSIDEKYLYKYIVKSISDATLTRKFTYGLYELLDFSVSQNIFGFFEGETVTQISTVFETYSSESALYLNRTIQCAYANSCEGNGDICDELCFGESCGQSCDTKCEIIEGTSKLACTFSFNPILQESTIYYRFTENDQHHKPLHLIKVIAPQAECRLANNKMNTELQVCTFEKVSGLRLFINEEVDKECNCEGIEIKSNERSCTSISLSYKEFLNDMFKLKIERDYNTLNSFIMNNDSSQIKLIYEILNVYHGELFAQLSNPQRIQYVFDENGNANLIQKIILTHTMYENKIEVDRTTNCTVTSNHILECDYNLQDLIGYYDLGLYKISYIHEECGEFETEFTIEIQHPPITLLYLTPNFQWLGVQEQYFLVYSHYFYNSPQYQPQTLTLVKEDDESVRKTVTLKLDMNKRNQFYFFSEADVYFVPAGRYYIIEHYLDSAKDKIHKDKTILFLMHHIKIYPESATYYTDNEPPTSVLTHFVDRPIYKEQIRSVLIRLNEKVTYDLTQTNITFYFTEGLIDFTVPGEHEIVITEIDGTKAVFTVFVKERKRLADVIIDIKGPQPGYENTTNIVEFSSSEYDMSRITRIVFSLMTEFGNEVIYTVDRIRIIESYDKFTCTLKVPIYLRHNSYYRLISVHNDDYNDMNDKVNYLLQGFFLESHFYIITRETFEVVYHVNFYSEENVDFIDTLYENNIANVFCNPLNETRWIYECSYSIKEYKAVTLNVTITKEETNIERMLQVFILTYIAGNTCVTKKNPTFTTTVTLESVGNIGTLRGVFDDNIFNGRTICYDNNYIDCHYMIEFTLPIDYIITSYDLYVDFPRINEYFRYPLPHIDIQVIPHIYIVSIPSNIITDTENRNGSYFDIKFNDGIDNSDISKVILKNENPNLGDIELTECKFMWKDNVDNTVYNCLIKEEYLEEKGTYHVHAYDVCGNLIEPADFEVYISYEGNFLTHITPKAMKLSELDRKSFEFIYALPFTLFPEIKLVNSYDVETDYIVTYDKAFKEEVRTPLVVRVAQSSEIGLMRIKSIFKNENGVVNNVDLSQLAILIYRNEVELLHNSMDVAYGAQITEVTLSLRNEIISQQISKVVLKSKGVNDEKDVEWSMPNAQQILVKLGGKYTINNIYQIIVFLAKDESSYVAFEIRPQILVRFYLNREFIDLGSFGTEFEIQVTPLYDSNNLYNKIYKITSSRKGLIFHQTTGKYKLPGESKQVTKRYVATYVKEGSVPLPEELVLYYYIDGVDEQYVVPITVKITDNRSPFFDFGYLTRLVYKNSIFSMKLLDRQAFSGMNYNGLQAFLKYNDKTIDLIHDEDNVRRFLLYAESVNLISGNTAELVIYEKGDRNAIVCQEQYIEFSLLKGPELELGECQNGGQFTGGNCKCPAGFYGHYCGKKDLDYDIITIDFVKTIKNETFNFNTGLGYLNDLLDYSASVKAKEVENTLLLTETSLSNDFENMNPTNKEEADLLFTMGSLMLDEMDTSSSNGRRLSSHLTREAILAKLKKTVNDIDIDTYESYNLPIQDIYYYKIKANSKAISQYLSDEQKLKKTYVDLKNISNPENGYYVLTINDNIIKDQLSINLQYTQNGKRLLDITPSLNEGEITVYFSMEDLPQEQISNTFNATLQQEYGEKGINVYSDKDPAFKDKCYTTNPDFFDYDLTQEYRRNNIYQNYSFVTDDSVCKYNGINSDGTFISYTCNYPQQSEDFTVNLEFKETPIKYKTEKFLALKCINKINDLTKNIALWLFAVLAVLMIVGFILTIIFKDKNQENQDSHRITPGKESSTRVSNVASTEDVQIEMNNNSTNEQLTFGEKFLNNLKELHPITANYFNKNKCIIPIFISSICTIFGFNALYFKESYIEDRIYDKSRNSFAYPLTNEAGVLFASIFSTVIFTVLAKLITLRLGEKTNIEIGQMIGCLAFCMVVMVFWWVYCVGFCGMYKNTQNGWLYMGIWGLLFNWIIFAPLSVLVVTLINSDILKQLFWV